jgi:hypothetical protein
MVILYNLAENRSAGSGANAKRRRHTALTRAQPGVLAYFCGGMLTLFRRLDGRRQAIPLSGRYNSQMMEAVLRRDGHSYSDAEHVRIAHVHLELRDGPKTRSHGKAQILQFGHSLRLFGPAGP